MIIAHLIVAAHFLSDPALTHAGQTESTLNTPTGTIQGTVEARATRYIKDTVVYLIYVEGDFAPPPNHPVVDQKNLVFLPHVLAIVKGTTVDFTNSDTVRHNIFSPSQVADNMNLGTYGAGQVVPWIFDKIGEAVLLCNVHAEMSAWVIVRQNPYFSITDKDGHFEITDVPAGQYTLKVWNKKLAAESQEVTVQEGEIATILLNLARKRR
jgi:plastocyanin